MVVPVSAMMDMMAYGFGEPRLVADPRLRRFLLLVEVLLEVPSNTRLRLAPVRGAGVAFSSLVVVAAVPTVGLEARTLAAAALASVAWRVRGELGEWVVNILWSCGEIKNKLLRNCEKFGQILRTQITKISAP